MNQQEIIQEFARRYQESYIWVCMPDTHEETMFLVERVTYDPDKLAQLSLTSPDYGRIVINMATTHKLKFKYPPVGVFQHGKDAHIFRRVPAKQYKHGIYHGNSSITPVYANLVGGVLRRERLEFEEVSAAYKAQTYTFKEALAMLAKGKHRSVALSNNFSLCLSLTQPKGYHLLYWETPVANMDVDGNITHVFEKAFDNVLEAVKGR
jgi:hypothetical protein